MLLVRETKQFVRGTFNGFMFQFRLYSFSSHVFKNISKIYRSKETWSYKDRSKVRECAECLQVLRDLKTGS